MPKGNNNNLKTKIMRQEELVGKKVFIGMIGHTYTCQLTETSYEDLMNTINPED